MEPSTLLDSLVEQYNGCLRSLLVCHAPLRTKGSQTSPLRSLNQRRGEAMEEGAQEGRANLETAKAYHILISRFSRIVNALSIGFWFLLSRLSWRERVLTAGKTVGSYFKWSAASWCDLRAPTKHPPTSLPGIFSEFFPNENIFYSFWSPCHLRSARTVDGRWVFFSLE